MHHNTHQYGPVVNGGLIDFQDNLQRGVCPDFAGQQQLAMAGGYGAGAGFALQQQLAAFQATPPNVAQPAALHPAQPGVSGGCFSGPPSFIHVNGVTYKPVEAAAAVDPRAAPATLAPAAPQPAATASAGSSDPSMRPLTEDELYRAIDDRVSSRVGEYVSRKLRHYHSHGSRDVPVAHHGRSDSSYEADEPRGASRLIPAPVVRDDVEAAVQRILQANAQVAAPSSSRGRVPLW